MSTKAQAARISETAMMAAPQTAIVDFGRDVANDLEAGEKREWLVTNGIGGFASGTLAGPATRRYHGLLVAALKPPLGRTLLGAKFEDSAGYGGTDFSLSTNRWVGGAVSPEGYRYVERFSLEGTFAVWSFAVQDALLEKRVWMEQGANTTYVQYKLIRASRPLELTVRALVNYRDYHSTTRGGVWRMNVEPVQGGLHVQSFDGATPFFLLSSEAAVQPEHNWYRDYQLSAESYRGLDDRDDHLHAGTFRVVLKQGDSATFLITTDPSASLDGTKACARRQAHEMQLLNQWANVSPRDSQSAPAWIRLLILAADQFIVSRPLEDDPNAHSVIAGYHWFGDWGRDTMIALPGLTLSTGRTEIARSILRTFARFVDRGMLPNRFPDAGEAPEYNTVDATLWYFEAIRQYFEISRDLTLLRELFPVLEDIIAWHLRGTRYNIHVDSSDGLLFAGEPGVQLTWMDAKVGDWVVTPRIGKPIEVNALWYNALVVVGQFARELKKSSAEYESHSAKAKAGFARFWNAAQGFCFDVLDAPDGNDASLRPNQIFAVSLPLSPLTPDQQRAVVDVCAHRLLTSHGLRSLDATDPHYQGHYGGGPYHRDSAYHQGTVWGWLVGPFTLAHLRVYGDAAAAASFLEPMAHHLRAHGLGTASEIFDGDAPFTPRGCVAQAWTVAEILRAWTAINAQRESGRPKN